MAGCVALCNACWLPDYLGVRGLAGRVVVSMMGALLAAVYWTAALPALSTAWFVAGRADARGL